MLAKIILIADLVFCVIYYRVGLTILMFIVTAIKETYQKAKRKVQH